MCTGLALMHISTEKLGLNEKGTIQDMQIFNMWCEISNCPDNILKDCSELNLKEE